MEYLNTLNISNMKCIHIFITDADYNHMCNNNKGLIPLIEQSKLYPKVKIIIYNFDVRGEYSKKRNIRKFLQGFYKYYKLDGCSSWINFYTIDEEFKIYNKLGKIQTEIINKDKRSIITTTYDEKGRNQNNVNV